MNGNEIIYGSAIIIFGVTCSHLAKKDLNFNFKCWPLIILIFLYFNHFFNPLLAMKYCLFLMTLLFVAIYDQWTKTIPRFIHFFIISIGLIGISNQWLLYQAILGALLPALPIFIVNAFFINQNKMGIGDIKLMFSCGFFIGYPSSYSAVFLALLMALIINLKTKKIDSFPFGPFLSVSYLLSMFI